MQANDMVAYYDDRDDSERRADRMLARRSEKRRFRLVCTFVNVYEPHTMATGTYANVLAAYRAWYGLARTSKHNKGLSCKIVRGDGLMLRQFTFKPSRA